MKDKNGTSGDLHRASAMKEAGWTRNCFRSEWIEALPSPCQQAVAVVQNDLELLTPCPPPLQCWDYRQMLHAHPWLSILLLSFCSTLERVLFYCADCSGNHCVAQAGLLEILRYLPVSASRVLRLWVCVTTLRSQPLFNFGGTVLLNYSD